MTAPDGKLRIFISWSGELAKEVAVILKAWIPRIVQDVDPWVSSKDIEMGKYWHQQVTASLGRSTVGIVVVTPDNQEAMWLNYEAGALAQSLEEKDGVVMPLLINMGISDLTGPMVNLQVTKFDIDDIWELLQAVNKRIRSPLSENFMRDELDEKWPKLETLVQEGIGKHGSLKPAKRNTDDLLEEVLTTVRELKRSSIDTFAGTLSAKTLSLKEENAKVLVDDVFDQFDVSIVSTNVVTTLDGIIHLQLLILEDPQPDKPVVVERVAGGCLNAAATCVFPLNTAEPE